MTAVFVHGVPETGRIWDGVRALIAAPSVALDLPGFGTARPDGFSATKDAYTQWLSDALDGIEGPIDLVGHDWGALLTLRFASISPGKLRSWVVDVANCSHPDYVWHDFARVWQTEGEGEAWWAAVNAQPADSPGSIAGALAAMGVPADQAALIGAASDGTMASCILDLYRSAVPNPHAGWGSELGQAARIPGLVVIPTNDPYNDPVLSGRAARELGARVVHLEKLNHAWMAQDPEASATLLEEFWSSLGADAEGVPRT